MKFKQSRFLREMTVPVTAMVICFMIADSRAESVIEVGPNHIVSVPRPDLRRNEVWLAASRVDPDTFVAVFHASDSFPQNACESMISKDGGQTWNRFLLPEESDCFDPMVVSGADGQFYISYSAWRAPDPVSGVWRGISAPIRVYTSLDDGDTWSEPLELNTPLRPDHQRMGIDLSGGEFAARVYIHWVEFPDPTVPGKYHLFLHYLDREGKTQSEASLVYAGEKEKGRPVSLEPLVLSDGTLLLPVWFQNSGLPLDPKSEKRPVYLVRSTDGGRTFGDLREVVEVGSPVWRTRAHRFSQVTVPVFAVDTSESSRYRDRAYAVWNDTRAGATSDIWLISSTDGGRTWSEPVRVNDFAAENSETAPPDIRMTPVVTVNRDGVVGVAWYDRREDPTRRCWKQYFSASLDGGRTFLPNKAISSAPSCPPSGKAPTVEVYNRHEGQEVPSWEELRIAASRIDASYGNRAALQNMMEQAKIRVREDAGLATDSRVHISFDSVRDEFQGHYTGLAPSTDGSFQAVWADSRLGHQEMYSTRVEVVERRESAPEIDDRTLNDRVEVIADQVAFDEGTGIVSFSVKLRNRSALPVYAPLTLTVQRFVTGGGAVFGSKEERGSGAEWDFSDHLGTEKRLDPGMISEPHRIRIRSSAEHGLDVAFDYEIIGRTAVE